MSALCETETNYDVVPPEKKIIRTLERGNKYTIIEADTSVPINVTKSGDVVIDLEKHTGPIDNISVIGIGYENLGAFKQITIKPKIGVEVLTIYDADAIGVGRSRNVELVPGRFLNDKKRPKLS